MNKLLIPVLFFAGFAGGYFLRQAIAPAPDGCNVNEACDIEAPSNLSANFSQSSLKLNWQPVEGAAYYFVSIVDLSSETPLSPIVRKTTEPGLTITDQGLVENHNYRSTVSAVCQNCAVSFKSATVDACLIVVEDLVEFRSPCREKDCQCNDTTPVAVPSNNAFTVSGLKEMHKVTVTCGGVTKWFYLQTENIGGNMNVKVPVASNFGSECGDLTNYQGPVNTPGVCGQLSGSTPNYTININQTIGGGATFLLSPGCTWTVSKCNGCGIAE